MYDTAPLSPQMQRARGRAAVSFVAGAQGARLKNLHQSGSAKAMLPQMHGAAPEVVFLNTAGGLTGGDQMRFALDLGAGVTVTATTQTAERAYASREGVADLNVDLSVGAGGRLDWLPQETILFDKAGLHRRTTVKLAADAQVLMTETVVLGRHAMGEVVETLAFRDHREVLRDGIPVLIEPLVLDSAILKRAGQSALLGGARAMATVALIAPGAEDAAARLGEVTQDNVEVASSGWNGKCVARALSTGAYALRLWVAQAIQVLRPGPLPRVWQR